MGYEYSLKYQALPIKCEKSHLWVALTDPEDTAVIAALSDITGMNIMPVFATPEEIRIGINRLFNPNEIGEAADTIHFIDSIIETGIANRASDIHIEPYHNSLRVRYRVDGHLHTYKSADIALLAGAISHLKIKSGMDISEKRRPQDGRFSLYSDAASYKQEKIEFRISILPTVFGEKAAIRLLYDNTTLLKKTELGFFPEDLELLTTLLKRPYGAVFITGPTGSGKSTTLSSFLEELNTELVNIVTVEDPVENPIQGVNHIAVEKGVDVSNVLRNILRQDPDIIMIGEIRDKETAGTAIQAAITGHIVLSTLHTNDAAGVIERLLDMGIEPYLAAAAINGVISQRLVRRICEHCKQPTQLTDAQAKLLGLATGTGTIVYKGIGCESCMDTGYKGRLAVYEIIVLTEDMQRKISENPYPFAAELRLKSTFKKTALRHLIEGNTSADEIIRVIVV